VHEVGYLQELTVTQKLHWSTAKN